MNIFLTIFGALFLAVGVLQFFQIGPCINNAYLYASKEDKKNKNFSPYYKQTGVCFISIAFIQFVSIISIVKQIEISDSFYLIYAVVVILFSIVSTVYINKKY